MRHSPRRAGTALLALFVSALLAVSVLAPSAASAQTGADATLAADATSSPASAAAAASVPTAAVAGFNPGNIISDANFFDSGSLDEGQIQRFLNSQVPSCASGYVCLKDYVDQTRAIGADPMCGAYAGGSRESAARIIAKVARACGISPKVILVTLQKEQGLVTHTAPSAYRYRAAMGQGCPDTAACDTRYYGLFNQIYGAAWQFKRYANPPGTSQFFTWYAPGRTWNILFNPNRGCGTSPVYVQNQATANLYYYTPYQPNGAALAAGYGIGDGCSSYGNRNFYNYYTQWFGSTQALPATTGCSQPFFPGDAAKVYVVQISALTARKGPNSSCTEGSATLSSGTIVQALAVYGEWLKIRWETGERWVKREYLRYASSAEAACAAPGGVGDAVRAYVVTAATNVRTAPSSGCGIGAREMSVGSILQAVASAGTWVKVRLEDTELWLDRSSARTSTLAEGRCAIPGDVGPASKQYVITADTAARLAPNSGCGQIATTVAAGRMVTALSAVDGWLRIQTGDTQSWISRTDTRRATAAELACLPPTETTSAMRRYVVSAAGTVGRSAPNALCDTGSTPLPAGTAAQATALSGDWLRLGTGSGSLWVERSRLVREDVVCAVPVDVAPAKRVYLPAGTVTARTAPNALCGAGSITIAAATPLTATAVTSSGTWLRFTVNGAPYWVDRSLLVTQTSGTTPAVTTAAVNLRSQASTASASLAVVPAATTVIVIGTSGDWRRVRTGTLTGWIRADYLR